MLLEGSFEYELSEHSECSCFPMFEIIILNFLGGQNMAKFKVTSFTVTVEVPMCQPVCFSCTTVEQWEDLFTYLRNNAQTRNFKRNYERCLALLEYACSFSGTLKRISNHPGALAFVFEFESFTLLRSFVEKILTNVKDVTI